MVSLGKAYPAAWACSARLGPTNRREVNTSPSTGYLIVCFRCGGGACNDRFHLLWEKGQCMYVCAICYFAIPLLAARRAMVADPLNPDATDALLVGPVDR